MPRHHRLFSPLLWAALAPGCTLDTFGGDTQAAAATTASSSTTGSLPSSATDSPGGASEGTVGHSTPTTGATTTTGPDSTGNPWTSGPCGSFQGSCGDLPGNPIECDVFAQDCPEGQKCAAVITDRGSAWNGLRCVDVNGTDEPGDPCKVEDVVNGIDSCVKGAMCWDTDEQGAGYCVALCTGSAEAPVCENGAACSISGEAILILCIPTCDPLVQDCHPGAACYPVGDTFYCAPDASDAGGQANDPCEYINVCDPGLMCADAAFVGMGCPKGSTGCCAPYCKFPGGACPNPDQQCVQYFDPMMLPPNDPKLDIGVCGLLS